MIDKSRQPQRPGVRQAIRPRRSPDLAAARPQPGQVLLARPDPNPIDQVFAKLKHLLRKAAERSFDTICDRIGDVLDRLPPAGCANYLRDSGYAAT